MNRYEAVRLGSVGAILLYIGYQINLEYQTQLAEADEIGTVLGVAQVAVDVNATVLFEPFVLGLAVVATLLAYPYLQPPY